MYAWNVYLLTAIALRWKLIFDNESSVLFMYRQCWNANRNSYKLGVLAKYGIWSEANAWSKGPSLESEIVKSNVTFKTFAFPRMQKQIDSSQNDNFTSHRQITAFYIYEKIRD